MNILAINTDIDIDFAERRDALVGIPHVFASMMVNEDGVMVQRQHPTGVYFQDVPVDPTTGNCSILYSDAPRLGYFKVDYLNNSIYNDVRDEEHLKELMDREPPWDFLENEDILDQLSHVHSAKDIIAQIKPKSVDDLAVVLALQRPGKRNLLGKTRAEIDAEIWQVSGEYAFKRAHAIAYAVSIVVQLNLLIDKMTKEMGFD